VISKTVKVAKEVDAQILRAIQELQKQIDEVEPNTTVPIPFNFS